MFRVADPDLLNNYNHYQEEDWEVWERGQEISLLQPQVQISYATYYKVVNFFIKHLSSSQQEDKYFKFNDIHFLYVNFSGTIISQSIRKDKLSLEVNDGTGSITCLIEDHIFDQIKMHKSQLKNAYKTVSSHKNSAIQRGTLLTIKATQNLFKHIPSKEDFDNGDMVLVAGKLTEHNGKKYVFVTKINCISVADHIKYMKLSLSSYDGNEWG